MWSRWYDGKYLILRNTELFFETLLEQNDRTRGVLLVVLKKSVSSAKMCKFTRGIDLIYCLENPCIYIRRFRIFFFCFSNYLTDFLLGPFRNDTNMVGEATSTHTRLWTNTANWIQTQDLFSRETVPQRPKHWGFIFVLKVAMVPFYIVVFVHK